MLCFLLGFKFFLEGGWCAHPQQSAERWPRSRNPHSTPFPLSCGSILCSKSQALLSAHSDQYGQGSKGKWKEEINLFGLCFFFFPGAKSNCHIFPLKAEQELAGICQAASSHTFSKYLGSDSPLSHCYFLDLIQRTSSIIAVHQRCSHLYVLAKWQIFVLITSFQNEMMLPPLPVRTRRDVEAHMSQALLFLYFFDSTSKTGQKLRL